MSITQTRKFDHITPVLFDLINNKFYLSIFKKYMQWIYIVKMKKHIPRKAIKRLY